MKKSTNKDPNPPKKHEVPADATENTETNRTENDHQTTVSDQENDNSSLPSHHHNMISNHGQNYKRRNNSNKEGVDRSKPGAVAVSSTSASTVPPNGNAEALRVLPGTSALHNYQRRNNRGGKTETSSTGNRVAEDDDDEYNAVARTDTPPSNAKANRPGATRVPGINQANANQDSNKSFLIQDDTGHSLETSKSMPFTSDGNSTAGGGSSRYLAEAFLVEESFHENQNQPLSQQQQQQPTPLVKASPLVEEEKPWYTQKWFVIMLVGLLIVTIIVAVAVPLATKGGPSSPVSNSPSASPFPSVVPSTRPSFAPTMTTTITAVVRLDSNPSDTSWRIDCENGQKNLINIPTGFYDASWSTKQITQPFEVGVGDTCTFLMTDASQDGLEEGSFYRVFLGTDYSDLADPVPVRLVDGGGNFGSQANVSFNITSIPDEPTPTPTTTPPPTVGRLPQPPPTIPQPVTPTAVPTVAIFVYITIVIQFDKVPSETGWNLFCNGVEERNITANTYSVPNGIISDTFIVQPDSSCEFTIRDTFGDGICCTFGNGYYQVLFHEEENVFEEGNFVVLENRTGVNPFEVQSVSFVASSTGTNN